MFFLGLFFRLRLIFPVFHLTHPALKNPRGWPQCWTLGLTLSNHGLRHGFSRFPPSTFSLLFFFFRFECSFQYCSAGTWDLFPGFFFLLLLPVPPTTPFFLSDHAFFIFLLVSLFCNHMQLPLKRHFPFPQTGVFGGGGRGDLGVGWAPPAFWPFAPWFTFPLKLFTKFSRTPFGG